MANFRMDRGTELHGSERPAPTLRSLRIDGNVAGQLCPIDVRPGRTNASHRTERSANSISLFAVKDTSQQEVSN
jgi:hypothetical protein